MKALSAARKNQNLKLISLTLYLGRKDHRLRRIPDLYPVTRQLPSDLIGQVLFPETYNARDIKILVLRQINIEESLRISAALNSGRMPHLTKLSISMCKYDPLHKHPQILLPTIYPNEYLSSYEYDSLYEHAQIPFPEIDLNEYHFSLNEPKNMMKKIKPIVCPHLTDLTLQRFVCSPLNLLTVAFSAKKSAVRYLDIRHSSRISGKLFILVGYSFQKLHTLNLKDCR